MNQVINTKSQGKLCGQSFSWAGGKKNKTKQTGRKKKIGKGRQPTSMPRLP